MSSGKQKLILVVLFLGFWAFWIFVINQGRISKLDTGVTKRQSVFSKLKQTWYNLWSGRKRTVIKLANRKVWEPRKKQAKKRRVKKKRVKRKRIRRKKRVKRKPRAKRLHRSFIKKFLRRPPGVDRRNARLAIRMAKAYRKKGQGYKPRAHHLDSQKFPKYTNRLIFETSPYLLQHAHNPVNWHAWGKAAFAKAKKENKPVLLSVGYSTCHWCHVMEKQSFESEKIAKYMNKHYIAIKVDREERTDVDGIYMSVVQRIHGSGGWPMTVWLTPDRKPFYGGTYYRPYHFLRLLKNKFDDFRKRPKSVEATANWRVRQLRQSAQYRSTPGVPTQFTVFAAARIFNRSFDARNGGRMGRPKFPSSFSPGYLLRYHRRTKDPKALRMAEVTLEKMARGGIYDQLGGGFHRYSVDSFWLVPHFEKMLYDNALLVPQYLDGFQVTKRKEFARIAREVLDYVIREMTAKHGGFFSATDADSEGHEGLFFLWKPAQLDKALSRRSAKWFKKYYGVTKRGNFEHQNILNVPREPKLVAKELGTSLDTLWKDIVKSRKILYKIRKKRIPPLCDTKIITSWNALMISAFAKAAMVFNDKRYKRQAVRAASFLMRKLQKRGRLYRTYKDGRARHNGYLEDYSFTIAALLDVYELTQNARWLRQALTLQKTLQKYYWDKARGGYYRTSSDHEKLLIRPKPRYDGAVPTGNSIQAYNLLRLYELTTKDKYNKLAEGVFKAFGARLQRWPVALSEMMLALEFYHDKPKEIVLVKPNKNASVEPFLAKLRKLYLPNRILVVTTQGKALKALQRLIPIVENKVAKRGKVTAYVCIRKVCELPTTDPAVFAKQISKVYRLRFSSL